MDQAGMCDQCRVASLVLPKCVAETRGKHKEWRVIKSKDITPSISGDVIKAVAWIPSY
jgi:hypothetical protein